MKPNEGFHAKTQYFYLLKKYIYTYIIIINLVRVFFENEPSKNDTEIVNKE